MELSVCFILYLLAINLAALAVCCHDKRAARRRARRVPEKTLLLLSAAGGAFGMLAGMLGCRHKTRHPSFMILVPLMCAVWGVLAAWLAIRAVF